MAITSYHECYDQYILRVKDPQLRRQHTLDILQWMPPKTGSTSLRWMAKYGYEHGHKHRYKRVVGARDRSFPDYDDAIVLVRDPLTRMLSAFLTCLARARRHVASTPRRWKQVHSKMKQVYRFAFANDDMQGFALWVDQLTSRGSALLADEVTMLGGQTCNTSYLRVWEHAMSLMYFLQPLPFRGNRSKWRVVHLEHHDTELRVVDDELQ